MTKNGGVFVNAEIVWQRAKSHHMFTVCTTTWETCVEL